MRLLSPRLLQKLGRTRLNVLRTVASTGVGERPSKAKGSGLEFADHRAYQLGDDLRHLDRHVHARLGQHYVKQFATYQQLPVTILLDASRSMAYGQPEKFSYGAALAAGLAYAGLAGGDQVLVGAFSNGQVNWHARLQGARRMAPLLAWLERLKPRGETLLAESVRAALPRLSEGLTLIISDWLAEGVEGALAALDYADQELVAVHLLAPSELEPERLGAGEVRLLDAEVGQEVEISLEAGLYQRYRQELEAWTLELQGQVRSYQGRYLRVRSDDDLERLFLRDWRSEGLIG